MSSTLSDIPESPFVAKVRPTDTIILRCIYYDGVEQIITIGRLNISKYGMQKYHDKTLRITDHLTVVYRESNSLQLCLQGTGFNLIKFSIW